MRKIFSTVLAGLLVTSVTGCGRPAAEKAASDEIGKMKEEVAVLKGITDEASAKAALPKLKAIHEEMAKLEKAAPDPTANPEATAKAMEKYGKELTDVTTQLGTEETRVISNPKLSAILGDALSK